MFGFEDLPFEAQFLILIVIGLIIVCIVLIGVGYAFSVELPYRPIKKLTPESPDKPTITNPPIRKEDNPFDPMLKISLNFFNITGKWKYEANCYFQIEQLHDYNYCRQAIVDGQDGITDGWQGSYYVVAESTDSEIFFHRHYCPYDFTTIEKRTTYETK